MAPAIDVLSLQSEGWLVNRHRHGAQSLQLLRLSLFFLPHLLQRGQRVRRLHLYLLNHTGLDLLLLLFGDLWLRHFILLRKQGQVGHLVRLPADAYRVVQVRRLLPPVDAIHVGRELGAGHAHVVDRDLLRILLRSHLVLSIFCSILYYTIPVRIEDLLQSVCVHRTDIPGPGVAVVAFILVHGCDFGRSLVLLLVLFIACLD